MPIKSFERNTAQPVFLGVLRKGKKRPEDGRRPGEDLCAQMRFHSEEQATMEDFVAKFGSTLVTRLDCLLPFADAMANCQQWYEVHTAGAIQLRHDGERAYLWRTKPDGVLHVADGILTPPLPLEKLPPYLQAARQDEKTSTTLFVFLAQWQRLAIVRVLTTSFYDAQSLASNLAFIGNLRSNHDARGIPLVLTRARRKVTTTETGRDGKKTQQKRTKWLLALEVAPSWSAAKLDWDLRMALPGADQQQLAKAADKTMLAATSSFVQQIAPPPEASSTHVDPNSPFANADGDDDEDEEDDAGEVVESTATTVGAVAQATSVTAAPAPPAPVAAPTPAAPAPRLIITPGPAEKIWGNVVHELAAEFGGYRDHDGSPDVPVIRAAVLAAGYTTVDVTNARTIGNLLRQQAQEALLAEADATEQAVG